MFDFDVFEEQGDAAVASSSSKDKGGSSKKKRSECEPKAAETEKEINEAEDGDDGGVKQQHKKKKSKKEKKKSKKEGGEGGGDNTNSNPNNNPTNNTNNDEDEALIYEESNFPKVTVEVIANDDSLYEVALPPGYTLEDVTRPIEVKEPARTYKFKLDPFQQRAVDSIEREQSVLVAAHTSAGKTAVAEYAIAKSMKNHQRVIYTTPLKALSNQKFRDFQEEFQDVGLMTGDVTINPSASCLVMTTEILRSMLYRGSEVVREVAWVVFDEIHYMRDRERGVVWEESIILVPKKVHFVFLSATIPNAPEFASWVAAVHSQPCHVVYTDYRPTPLQHYVFPAGGEGLYLVVDEKGVFRDDQFHKACSVLENAPSKAGGGENKKTKAVGGKTQKGGSDIYKIVKVIMERNYDPVIVFAFSKKDCEALAMQMAKLDFNNEEEKANVEKIFNSALDCLNDDDRHLPQVEHMLPLLQRGIGIHHGGLLPILKEVIEILFQEGLVKCLMATETFSMGLNMPAKTVVFTSVRKWDGQQFRWVQGGEYIQMSGRAGRRGLDDRGIVILMMDEKLEPAVAKGMLKGHSDPLNSTFHLGYNMLLNMLRFDGADPVMLIKNSFFQYQSDKNKPQLRAKIETLMGEFDEISIENEQNIAQYHGMQQRLFSLKSEINKFMLLPVHCLTFLNTGRLVHIRSSSSSSAAAVSSSDDINSNDYGWGVLISFSKKSENPRQTSAASSLDQNAVYIIDVLVQCVPTPAGGFKPAPKDLSTLEKGVNVELQVVSFPLVCVWEMSAIKISVPSDIRSVESRNGVGKTLAEVMRRFGEEVPLLSPIEDMGIKDGAFAKILRNAEDLEQRVKKHDVVKMPNLSAVLKEYSSKMEIMNEIKAIKKELKQTAASVFQSELKQRKRVLRRLGYTNKDDVVEMKGRVACLISAGDELVVSELLFGGIFNPMTPQQCGAILTTFIFDEPVKEQNIRLRPELEGAYRALQDAARRVATVSNECRLAIDVDNYVKKFNPMMMEVAFQWCSGAKFSEVAKIVQGTFEGSIIRCIRRLEELLMELIDACKVIGNAELEQKFLQTQALIKRDIVFAASLYL